jgi:hypothetical protein
MSAVADRLVHQLQARRIRENEYRAQCPVHQGKSKTSLSIKDAGDRVLVHCHAGCELQDILAALGMRSPAELFDTVRSKRNPEAERQGRVRRGLQIWCDDRLNIVCLMLRTIEPCIRDAAEALERFENGGLPRNAESDEEWRDILARAYRLRSELEEEFEVLNGDDAGAKKALFARICGTD